MTKEEVLQNEVNEATADEVVEEVKDASETISEEVSEITEEAAEAAETAEEEVAKIEETVEETVESAETVEAVEEAAEAVEEVAEADEQNAEAVEETPAEEQSTAAEKTTSSRPGKFHMMLFWEGKEGVIKQMGVNQRTLETIIGCIIVVILVLVFGLCKSISSNRAKELSLVTANESVTLLQEKVTDLEAENLELNDKVTILSDTINMKVEQENVALEESNEAHTPNGFPLTASATISVDEEDENLLLFSSTVGSSVIATGAGIVSEVATDAAFQNRVTIDHGNGYKSVYLNDGNVMVKEGDEVIAGSVIYVIGSDNMRFGYQIFQDDAEINPNDLLPIDG